MAKTMSRNDLRQSRHARVRTKISGTPECPRLNVFRSSSHIPVSYTHLDVYKRQVLTRLELPSGVDIEIKL